MEVRSVRHYREGTSALTDKQPHCSELRAALWSCSPVQFLVSLKVVVWWGRGGNQPPDNQLILTSIALLGRRHVLIRCLSGLRAQRPLRCDSFV